MQAGFVLGALLSAITGLADRLDPRRLFALAALTAATANAALPIAPIGSFSAIALRFLTGVLLAGVYPVGMKIAVGCGKSDHGFLVSLLIAGLTFGSASSHMIAALGADNWRLTVALASLVATAGGLAIFLVGLGPYHGRSERFRFSGPIWLTFLALTLWGFTVVPDSSQFPALVADFAPADKVGSIMTLQTALGFGLTVVIVQITPWLADAIDWQGVILILALSPAYGVWAMARLARIAP